MCRRCQIKLNDRPKDTFSGEAGDDMSVPRRKENGTAPLCGVPDKSEDLLGKGRAAK